MIGKLSATLVTGALVMCAASASAGNYSADYTSTTGAPMTGSFVFTTSDELNSKDGYTILNVTGNVNGDAITGVVHTGSEPLVSHPPGLIWNVDNNYFDKPQILSTDGVLFSTASGLQYNMWGTSATAYTLASSFLLPSGLWDYGPRSNGYFGAIQPVAATPIASYGFGGTLAANEPGRQPLAELAAASTNTFVSDNVFGVDRQVYSFDTGASGGGLSWSNADHALVDSIYSIVMTVKFTNLVTANQSTLLLATSPDGRGLDVRGTGDPDTSQYSFAGYPGVTFGQDQWHKVALTFSNDYEAIFMDGVQIQHGGGDGNLFMRLGDPEFLLKFLTAAGSGHATGYIAGLSIYSESLSDLDAIANTTIPLAVVPEPAAWAMMLIGFGLSGTLLRRRRMAVAA